MQNEQITTEQRDSLWSLTDQYVYKNADLLQNYFTDRGEVVSSDYILNNIELEGAGDKAQTTYDGLVLKLVSLEQQVASSIRYSLTLMAAATCTELIIFR